MYLTSGNLIFHVIIAIPTLFILRWIYGKVIQDKTYNIVASLLTTLILTPVIYVGAIVVFFSILFHEPTRDFDKNSWQSDIMSRYQMADDIIKSKLLISKDSNQVKQLLGNKSYNYTDTINQVMSWTYDMGAGGGGLGFMFHNLIIKFDNNKVVSVDHAKIRD